MNRNLLLIVVVLLGEILAAAAPRISKEQQNTCKMLKKSLNAKSVEVFEGAPDAPYYIYQSKDGMCGIVDKNGNIIANPRYEGVLYFPAYNENTFTVNLVNDKYKPTGRIVTVVTQPSAEGFWGCSERGIDLISRKGDIIRTFTQKMGVSYGNYFYLTPNSYPQTYEGSPRDMGVNEFSILSLNRGKGEGHGILLRTDGAEVLTKVDWLTFCDNDSCAVYNIVNDNGTNLHGMKRLAGHGYDIPAEFHTVYRYSVDGKWMVQARATSPTVVYEPSTQYNTKMRDMGEDLYAQCKYDEVLDYYAKEGIDAPWAKFYSAKALCDRWLTADLILQVTVENMEKGSGLPNNEENILGQANLMVQSYNTAIQLFNAYLATGDTNFEKEARNDLERTRYLIDKTNDYLARYRKVRGHAAQVTSAQQAQQQAQLQAILGVFTNALSAIALPSSNNRSGSYVSSSANGSVQSSPASSSNSADNSGRKAFLRNQIADWKNKLKKAEQSYQQALSSGDDTWEKKRVIDSKRNTVDECLNMIKEYESELNSLK